MIAYNPGNLLPFHTQGYSGNDRRWLRHKQVGQDAYPFGLPCPRTRLMPFQVYFDFAFASIDSFFVQSADDGGQIVIFDVALLEVSVKAGGTGFWVTWKAEEPLNVVPDCGYWCIVIAVNSGEAGEVAVESEALYLFDACGFEKVGLSIGAETCAVDGGNISFDLVADVETGSGATWEIQRFSAGWSTIGTGASVGVTETLSSETRNYRIRATTPCGLIITTSYTATWNDADGCGTLTLGAATISTNEAGILSTNPVWRLNFSHSTDKANVLYQTGYEQYLYLPLPVWDVPEVARDVEVSVNGSGEEIRRFTRTVERRGFEVADLPDYVLGFLAKSGDLDTILFEDAKLVGSLVPVNFEVDNLTFESPNRQGTALNIGRFYFDVEAEAFQGCQENFVLD